MRNLHTSTCLNKEITLPIIDQLKVELTIHSNPYLLPIQSFFSMAARINKKRSFLFVSKLLGKHLPIQPEMGLVTGALLACRYSEVVYQEELQIKEDFVSYFFNQPNDSIHHPFMKKELDPIIIGFAETATALGLSFFHSFQSAYYFHTTREHVEEMNPIITFEEEHSHATSHRCYLDDHMLDNEREIILVDDEVTTGNTAMNIIRSIQSKYPRKVYTIVSILDWKSALQDHLLKELEKELQITIHNVSLLKGDIQIKGNFEQPNNEVESAEQSPNIEANISVIHLDQLKFGPIEKLPYSSNLINIPYIKVSGRFGLHSAELHSIQPWIENAGEYLRWKRTGSRTLCLGTGEFMYLPMKLSSLMGQGVRYHSTTRSPIYIRNQETYGARYGLSFPNPEDWEIKQNVYNIPPDEYDEIFLFFEREVPFHQLFPLLKELEKTRIKEIHVVFFSGRQREFD